MPQRSFEVMVVARENPETEREAIAGASQYLAYADQSDTFGYHATIDNVTVHDNGGGVLVVGIRFTAPIASDKELKRFMDEMTQLSRVSSVEILDD